MGPPGTVSTDDTDHAGAPERGRPAIPVPPREAGIALASLALLAAAVLLAPEAPGPGPLGLCTLAAVVHAALLAPAMAQGRARERAQRSGTLWAFFPLLPALPALVAMSYGHAAAALLGALLLVGAACLAGWASRALGSGAGGRFYLPSMLLFFVAPYALHYLVREFGARGGAAFWLRLSPAAEALSASGWPAAYSLVLLLCWPVWALARRAYP